MTEARVKISRGDNNYIHLKLPYNPIFIGQIKTITGHRWNPEQKYWIFHYSEDTIKRLLDILRMIMFG